MLKIKIKLFKKIIFYEGGKERGNLQLIKNQIKNNQSQFTISFTFI